MADDDDLIRPPGIPDEVWDTIVNAHTKARMIQQAAQQEVGRFYQELSSDHLQTLAKLFNVCANQQGAAAFHEGFTRGVLAGLHDTWPGWDDPTITFGVPQPTGMVEVEQSLVPPPGLRAEPEPEAPAPMSLEERGARMVEYGLIPNPDDPRYEVACTNCGQGYVSVEDRMVKPPGAENCPGCVNKAKWG